MGLTKTYKDGSTPDIVIIGAGFSGLCAGIRLQTQLNLHSYRIFELEPDIGGTWWANTYPGCACDVKSHNYSFTFEPNYEWSKAYADQPEIWEYMRRVARKYNIYDKVRFQTEIKRVQWDDDRQKWILDYVDLKSGQADRTEADIVFSGTGPLRIPLIPKEFDNFTGPKWHTAQWDHSYDLTNKRVAVVGSGASAIQVVPSIVNKVKTLEYYQRTASYVIPRNNNPYNAVWRWMFRNIPLFHRAYHKILYWSSEVLIFSFSTKLKARFPRALMSWLAWFFRFAQIRDKTLRKKLTPTYEIGCRRVVVSSDYYPALTRKNVNVHTEAIAGVKGNTLILKDGSVQEVDALVLATGFQVQNFLPRNFLIGKGGRDLMETWDNGVGPQTYYGLTAPETPNMFFLLGPHTALGHNSVLFMVETQVEYAIKAISYMMKNNLASLQVKEDATNAFMDEMDRKMEGMVWSSACKSWYKNEAGKVTSLWWGSCSSYWRRLRNFHPSCFTGVERV
ncbi:MAG: putative flavin-binding monooxygenase-like protein [Benniella sp.]|nr:MAG: putative flavin-binding monooxygenase-like protein [Benniella sp.]